MKVDVFQTGPLEVNTYILKDEETKEAVLIDVGGSFNEIKKLLEEEGYSVKFVLNTHGHFDHLLGSFEIQRNNYDIPVYLHKDDVFHIENMENETRMWGVYPETEKLKITSYIDEKSDLKIGDKKISVLHTPGHSKGSVSYYVDSKLFSGDALFYRTIGRTDFIDANYEELITSIKSKIFTLPEDTKVFPGHGPSTTVKEEKNFNSYLK